MGRGREGQEVGITKGATRKPGGRGDNGYVYYLDYSDGLMGVNICCNMMHIKYVV